MISSLALTPSVSHLTIAWGGAADASTASTSADRRPLSCAARSHALESATIAARYIVERKLKPVFATDMAIRVKAHVLVFPALHAKRKPVASFLAWMKRQASACN
jgi:hypothetical protein